MSVTTGPETETRSSAGPERSRGGGHRGRGGGGMSGVRAIVRNELRILRHDPVPAVILVAMPIALILYFIAVTDRPFQGGVSVSADPYRSVLENIMEPEMRLRR